MRCRIPQSDGQRATRMDPMVVLGEVVARVLLATPLRREVVTAVAIDVIHKRLQAPITLSPAVTGVHTTIRR